MGKYFTRELNFPEYQKGKFEFAVMQDGAVMRLIGYFPSAELAAFVASVLNAQADGAAT